MSFTLQELNFVIFYKYWVLAKKITLLIKSLNKLMRKINLTNLLPYSLKRCQNTFYKIIEAKIMWN